MGMGMFDGGRGGICLCDRDMKRNRRSSCVQLKRLNFLQDWNFHVWLLKVVPTTVGTSSHKMPYDPTSF